MIEGRNIICLASNWSYDPTSKHHVMRILSERNHVIWVNYHASRRPRLSAADMGAVVGKLRQFAEGPRRVSEGMTVLTPMVVPLPGSAAATAVNRSLLVRQIRSVLKTLPDRPVQLWSFAPDVSYLCGRFGEEAVVYYCVDEFSGFTGYDREATLSAERRLCEKADIVFTTSSALYVAKSEWCRRCETVTHGVDFEHFALAMDETAATPADIADIPGPILGFWGLIQDWFDVDLVAAAAHARADWSFVLIGEAATDVSALRRLPNVHLLGRRPYESLPAYGRSFDVGLIPFRVNDLTHAVNPIKLREYLSAGLPVVSTPMPEVEVYREWVEIANGPEAFVAACEKALVRITPADRAARRERMKSETWPAKVETLSDHVMSAIQPRQGVEAVVS
mgnify:CR=1 FL=1